MYTPSFIEGVTVTVYNYDPTTHQLKEITSPVNPVYCLSDDPNDPGGVQAFIAMFPQFQATITLDNPLGPGFVGSSSARVPFIIWGLGGMTTGPMNAGVMADIFNHGYPEAYASGQVVAAVTSQLGF